MNQVHLCAQQTWIQPNSIGTVLSALPLTHVVDVKKIYLMAALKYFEYKKMPLTLFLEWIIEQYNLCQHTLHWFVHLEIQQAVWGLPLAGILTNKWLRCKLVPFGYYKSTYTLGLWWHKTQSIMFTLVVDNFGVKYDNKSDVDHLIATIKKDYSLT